MLFLFVCFIATFSAQAGQHDQGHLRQCASPTEYEDRGEGQVGAEDEDEGGVEGGEEDQEGEEAAGYRNKSINQVEKHMYVCQGFQIMPNSGVAK